MTNDFEIRLAKKEEIEQINDLYNSVKNSSFTTWNEYYPTLEFIEYDIKNNGLYILTSNDYLIGAISVVKDNELDELSFWENKCAKEIARICIRPSFQNMGLSKLMITYIENILIKNNISSVHLLCAIKNIPAYIVYKKLGYKEMGKVFMYDNYYYALEKLIKVK